MKIRLKPMDLLFFRDSKPFTKGENYWAESLLMPNLSTIYGAIRSAYFSQHPEELIKANEVDDPTRNLVIKDVHFIYENTLLYPLPFDLVYGEQYKKKDIVKHRIHNRYPVIKLECRKIDNCASNIQEECRISHYFVQPENQDNIRVQSLINGYFDEVNFSSYIEHIDDYPYEARVLSNWIVEESKIGIARNDQTHGVQESMLYRIGQLRYDDKLEMQIEFEGLELPPYGFFKMGGKGNSVSYKLDRNEDLTIEQGVVENARFLKVYLETATFFQNGWIPDGIAQDTLEGFIDNREVVLLGACVGRHQMIGGFDLKKQVSKPLRMAVPAGSIYLFELKETVTTCKSKRIRFGEENDRKQGYGSAYVIYY